MMLTRTSRIFIVFIILLIPMGCATYYQRNAQFQQAISAGQFDGASKLLDKQESKEADGKNRILYYLNRGYVAFMQQNHELSNKYFDTAELLIEQQRKNLGSEALAMVSNPNAKPYKPEDFEVIMVNVYKALNYTMLGNMSDALVEARRINLKLQDLDQKYKDTQNRYQRDAFAHLLMGLIYDADGDYNNAFIAYRNALEVYQNDYTQNFGNPAPEQLKRDVMRTAYLNGFKSELGTYEKQFNTKYIHKPTTKPELVFLWLNGFGPVKSEWSINFTKVMNAGNITFVNEEFGFTFPFPLGNLSSSDQQSLQDISMIRVAFTKYTDRYPVYFSANLLAGGNSYPLEMAENVNEIAHKTLRDRMMRELGNSLLRVAVKQSLVYAASKADKNLGWAASWAAALTEKADTRNWQTLPFSISYSRVPVQENDNALTLQLITKDGKKQQQTLNYTAPGKRTYFHVYQSLDSTQPATN